MATTKYIDIKVRTKGASANVDRLDRKMKGLGLSLDKTRKDFVKLSAIALAII